MRYTSDKIKEILTSESAQRGLDYITPIYSEAVTALWIMEAIGLEVDEMRLWGDEFYSQVIPQTATWILPYIEEQYGLPSNDDTPLSERRGKVLFSLRNKAPMNPTKLKELISLAVGIETEIEENVGKNAFRIRLKDTGTGGYTLTARNITDELKPAHLIYDIYVKPENIIFKNRLWADLKNIVFLLRNNNMGAEFISLDGRRNLDGTWFLTQAFIKGIIFHSFKVNTHFYNQWEGLLALKTGIASRTINIGHLYNIIFTTGGLNNLGIYINYLNGNKKLDGSWNLETYYLKCLVFHNLGLLLKAENINRLSDINIKYGVVQVVNERAVMNSVLFSLNYKNLILETVYLDGKRNLDGSWMMDTIYSKYAELYKICIWLNVRYVRLLKDKGNIKYQASQENSKRALLNSVVFNLNYNNLIIETMYLDGKRNIDGSWLLKTLYRKELSLNCLALGIGNRNICGFNIANSIFFSKWDALKTVFSLGNIRYIMRASNISRAYSDRVYILSRWANAHKNSGIITIDTMYKLDGNVMLDGQRKLNADIIRSEL